MLRHGTTIAILYLKAESKSHPEKSGHGKSSVKKSATGAAQSLADEPAAVSSSSQTVKPGRSGKAHGTGKVLSEMAAGAVSGAAKSILPAEKAKGGKFKRA